MAVSKAFVFIVLAITYNQGAARPHKEKIITKHRFAHSEGFEVDPEGDIKIGMPGPAIIKDGLVIVVKGTIDMTRTTMIVELPSKSGKESCRLTYNYDIKDSENIYITPAVDQYERAEYSLSVESGETPTFALKIIARVDTMNTDLFGMLFSGNGEDFSSQLLCPVHSFKDVDTIVIKDGVSRVSSLHFEFPNH
nr:uncharacterized protein LOC110373561 [Helicoverpa armigera]